MQIKVRNMDNVRFEIKGTTGYLTISRPSVLNALNRAALGEIDGVLGQIEKEPELKCLLITGEGKKAFVAGADIEEMADMTEDEALEFSRFGNRVFSRLERLDIPTIALVNGYALGGGCELALSCDMIIAASNAVFALPETSLGIMCGFGGTQRLARRVGPGAAKRMIFACDRIQAEEALRMRLCDSIAEPDNLMEEGLALAERIGRNAKYAVSYAKQAIDAGLGAHAAFETESILFSQCFKTGEAGKIMKAFLDNRKTDRKKETDK
jgi:enoyl-CoA hydratase